MTENKNKRKSVSLIKENFFQKTVRYAKAKPGFAITVVFAVLLLVMFALMVWVIAPMMQSQNNDAEDIKVLHESNQEFISEYLKTINEMKTETQKSALDEAILFSSKSDLEWLKQKENELFLSKPPNELFAKEIAFTALLSMIIQTNELASIQFYEEDYEKVILEAKEKQITAPDLLAYEEKEVLEFNEQEEKAYEETINKLFSEYISKKKEYLNSNAQTEKKYVEAKKIIVLYEALKTE
jgi:hypothetical protein